VPRRPHTLGIDDGPVGRRSGAPVEIVGVMMEGAELVEAVARTRFPKDGPSVTGFLAEWVGGLRARPALHAVFLGGITIAGLSVIDLEQLSGSLDLPVIAVNRRDRANHRLGDALRAARLEERLEVVARTPASFSIADGVWAAVAGTDRERATRLVLATQAKSGLPEPLRLAHLIARAVATGESRGRP
jgi:hypothetical protein